MTLMGSRTWDSTRAKFMLQARRCARGSQTWAVAFTSIPTELITRNLHVVVETYSGVDTVGDAVTAGGTIHDRQSGDGILGEARTPGRVRARDRRMGARCRRTLTKRQATMMLGGAQWSSGMHRGPQVWCRRRRTI